MRAQHQNSGYLCFECGWIPSLRSHKVNTTMIQLCYQGEKNITCTEEYTY